MIGYTLKKGDLRMNPIIIGVVVIVVAVVAIIAFVVKKKRG